MPGWIVITLGYLIGCLPAAYLAGRLARGRDIRRMGDENAGAANAYRELGSATGTLVFILDAAKGAAVILFAQAVQPSQGVVLLAGLAVVAGHNWPVFLGFRGGRGVSTTIGVLMVLATTPMLILALPTLGILAWRRSVTPAMVFMFIGLIFAGWWQGISGTLILYGLGLAALSGITTLFRTWKRALSETANPSID